MFDVLQVIGKLPRRFAIYRDEEVSFVPTKTARLVSELIDIVGNNTDEYLQLLIITIVYRQTSLHDNTST